MSVLASEEAAGGATDPKLNPEELPELAKENPDFVESPALVEDDPKENPVLDFSALDPNVGKVLDGAADLLLSVEPKLNPEEGGFLVSSVLGVEPNVKVVDELSEDFESDFVPKTNPVVLDSFLSDEVDDPKLNPAKSKKKTRLKKLRSLTT